MSCYTAERVTVVPYKKVIGKAPNSGLPIEVEVDEAYLVYEPARNMFHGITGHSSHLKSDFMRHEFYDEKWQAENAANRRHLLLQKGLQGQYVPDHTINARRR